MIYPYSEKTEVLNTKAAIGNLLAIMANHDIVELQIEEDGVVPAHSLPIDVTFYVVSGNGTLNIENQEWKAQKGDVLEVKKDQNREWKSTSPETLKLLVIKQK